MIRRRFAPGEIWRRPPAASGCRARLADAAGVLAAAVLLPFSILVMLATLGALPILRRVSARKGRP